ncbi:GNAT family N-acetyltransferase [Kiloniella majae]|uniref:GNAT family N-acetyltransferase n=1 Tax=Kiloniella majae TaxID=1938558 RepID=UPI000A2772EA|nr:GNAT family N-acetyltransferase [Kiloniella majae]
MSQLRVEVHPGINTIPPEAWDRCARNDAPDNNPFISHAFLSALEESESVCAETGWQPQHLTIMGDNGTIVACAPLYLKSHSYGEYVFDWSWANAYERAGRAYYPKLQSAVPFSPVTGKRLLIAPTTPEETKELRLALINAMLQILQQYEASSLHLTFTTEQEWHELKAAGLLARTGMQYHWENNGYQSFDDFLSALSSRKRKAIRKERREAHSHGLEIKTLTGDDLTSEICDQFYQLYLNTVDKKYAHDYLNRDFFQLLGSKLASKVILSTAWDQSYASPIMVAGALNLVGGDTLYGRNWGSHGHYPNLHFELCYYQAIDYAITHGLKRVEAGAQGEHKIQRGYLPTKTYSLHGISDPNFRDAIARFLQSENSAVDREIEMLCELGPFKK